MNTHSSVLGGLYGLLVGDAVGVPFEFHRPNELPNRSDIGFELPLGFNRAHRSAPEGAWSDDGAQALCLLASLLEKDRLDMPDFAQKLIRWANEGYLAVDGEVFDIGNQTRVALDRLVRGASIANAACNDIQSNGNGSLMRVLPLALWHAGTDVELVRDAFEQSHVTHAHIRSKVCCALYVLLARNLLKGVSLAQSVDRAKQQLQSILSPTDNRELTLVVAELATIRPKGSGYVVDTLAGAIAAVAATRDYKSAVQWAISLGNDTDTTAAIAGGLAGIIYGMKGIPPEWFGKLAGARLVMPLANALTKRLCNVPPEQF